MAAWTPEGSGSASESYEQNCLKKNFAKSCVLSCSSNFYLYKLFHHAVLELQALKAVIKGVFSRSYCCCYGNPVSRKIITCSPRTWEFFESMIVASMFKENGYNDPSISMCWKLFWDTLKKLNSVNLLAFSTKLAPLSSHNNGKVLS